MGDQQQESLVSLTINGQTVQAARGTTILQAAKTIGVEIPAICYHPNLSPNAVCRLCAVEVVGSRVLQPACVVPISPDMIINTETKRVNTARRVILELLASTVDLCEAPEIQTYIERYGADSERFAGGTRREFEVMDDNPFFIRDYNQCVMCWRCIQVCADDVQYTYALTWGGRGIESHVATAYDAAMPDTTCVFCGNCVDVCPTGALEGKIAFELKQISRDPARDLE
jgi:NADH dehydrogenase/NADH:ubiquinone oxidoreductase subunit G